MLEFTPSNLGDEIESPIDQERLERRTISMRLEKERSMAGNWGRVEEVGRSETLCCGYSWGE